MSCFLQKFIWGLTLSVILCFIAAPAKASDACADLNVSGKAKWTLFEDKEEGFQFCYPSSLRFKVDKGDVYSGDKQEISFFDTQAPVEEVGNVDMDGNVYEGQTEYVPLTVTVYKSEKYASKFSFMSIDQALEQKKIDKETYDGFKARSIRYLSSYDIGMDIDVTDYFKNGFHVIVAELPSRLYYQGGGYTGASEEYKALLIGKNISIVLEGDVIASEHASDLINSFHQVSGK